MNKDEYGCLNIGSGVIINGEMEVPQAAYVAGEINGKLSANHVELEDSAKFEGEISAATVEVSGRMKGKLTAREFLSIRPGGKVDGEIEHGDLEVQRGGSIAGTIKSLSND
jgi:cytoskeletal protein CcmA (bactofilin family)